MLTTHKAGQTYPAGTRYSNAVTYDEATYEFAHGWQVFQQRRQDGTPTGHKSFINNDGILCGVEIAERERARAMQQAAPMLLEALQVLLASSQQCGEREWEMARAAIAAATGKST